MAMAFAELKEQVRALSEEDKHLLLAELIAELDGDSRGQLDPAIEAAWIAEAERRRQEIIEGKVKGIAAAQVFADVRANLKR